MSKDPFDLSNIDDLPVSIRNDLRAYRIDRVENNIMNLFKLAGRSLNLDEVTVGYFRQYGETKSRKYLMTKLYNMSRTSPPFLKSIRETKGLYCILTQSKVEQSK